MKKLLFLFAISFYSIAGSAQATLYVDNNSAVNVDVQGIAKMTSTCVTTSYCPLSDMMGILAGGSSSQSYTGCATTGNINLPVFVAGIIPPAPPIMVQIQWCGTQQSGTWGGGTYVLDIIGAGPDLLLDLN